MKVSDKTKQRVEHVQSKLHLERNVKMSQMDILDVLVEAALDAGDALDRLANAKQDMGAKQQAATWKSMLENPPDWGIDDLSEHVDESIAQEMK